MVKPVLVVTVTLYMPVRRAKSNKIVSISPHFCNINNGPSVLHKSTTLRVPTALLHNKTGLQKWLVQIYYLQQQQKAYR